MKLYNHISTSCEIWEGPSDADAHHLSIVSALSVELDAAWFSRTPFYSRGGWAAVEDEAYVTYKAALKGSSQVV